MPNPYPYIGMYPSAYANSDTKEIRPSDAARHQQLSQLAAQHYQQAFNTNGPLPAGQIDMTGLAKAPETLPGLPEVITCTKVSPRDRERYGLSLTCENSIYGRTDLYRRHEKDYDKYVYVRADLYRTEMVRVAEQANELIVLSVENTQLKEEITELRHLLENS